MVLVLLNRSPDAEVRLGTVTLTELDDLPLTPPAFRTAVDGCSNVGPLPERAERAWNPLAAARRRTTR